MQEWYRPLLSPCQVWWGWTSRAVGVGEKVTRFLFICFSVTLLNDKLCERHVAINPLEYGIDLGTVGYGKVCSCVPAFSLLYSVLCWAEPSHNDKVENTAKFGIFRPSTTTNWSSRDEIWQVSVDHGSILACTPLPGSVRGWVQEHLDIWKLVKCAVYSTMGLWYLPITVKFSLI